MPAIFQVNRECVRDQREAHLDRLPWAEDATVQYAIGSLIGVSIPFIGLVVVMMLLAQLARGLG